MEQKLEIIHDSIINKTIGSNSVDNPSLINTMSNNNVNLIHIKVIS